MASMRPFSVIHGPFEFRLAALAALAAFLLTSATAAEDASRPARHSRAELHMGVEFEVVLYASDAERADEALSRAMARIAELDKALSDYDPESELSRLSATSNVPPGQPSPAEFPAVKLSDDLWNVLSAGQHISRASDGAFDMTVGPLTRLWRRARRQRELPEPELLAAARQSVGYPFLRLDADEKTARLLKPNMRLDLGGIAKGFAADEAVKAVQRLGIARVLVRASGDIVCGESPPGEKGWKVGVAPLDAEATPGRWLALADRGVSTSGDARQHLVVDGKRYSHIIDPRTGMGISGRSSVTVVAPRGMLSDGLASAVSVLGPERGRALVEKFEGVELYMVYEDEAGVKHVVQTPGFAKYETAPPTK